MLKLSYISPHGPAARGLLAAMLALTPVACTETASSGSMDSEQHPGTSTGVTSEDEGSSEEAGDEAGDESTGGGQEEESAGDEGGGGGGDGGGEGPDPCDYPVPFGPMAEVGELAPHFEGIVGASGELYNLCQDVGKPIAIHTGVVWCGPCQQLTACLGGADQDCVNLFGGSTTVMEQLIEPLKSAVAEDRIEVMTVLLEDQGGGPPSVATAQNWFESLNGNPNVRDIADVDQLYFDHLTIFAFPSLYIIGEDGRWLDLNGNQVWGTLVDLVYGGH